MAKRGGGRNFTGTHIANIDLLVCVFFSETITIVIWEKHIKKAMICFTVRHLLGVNAENRYNIQAKMFNIDTRLLTFKQGNLLPQLYALEVYWFAFPIY